MCKRLLKLTNLNNNEVWIDCQKVVYCSSYSSDADHNCTEIFFDSGHSLVVRQSISYVHQELGDRL